MKHQNNESEKDWVREIEKERERDKDIWNGSERYIVR